MTWYAIPSLLTISLVCTAIQWPWIRRSSGKEKASYWVLLAIGWTLGLLLYFFPHLPGPSQLIDHLFGRIGATLINRGQADS